jgi:hypothetical protein
MSRQNLKANKIYKLYKTANSTVSVPSNIICTKGIKQVGGVTSGERGTNVKMIVAVNAIGNYVPSVLTLTIVLLKQHTLTRNMRTKHCPTIQHIPLL